MVIEFVISRCNKTYELAQASVLWGTVAQMSDVAHEPLVSSLGKVDWDENIITIMVKWWQAWQNIMGK